MQDSQTLDVPFSFEEPEYTYDTGYLKALASPPNRTSYLQDSGYWIVAGGFTLTTMILVIWLRRKRELQHTNELVKPTES